MRHTRIRDLAIIATTVAALAPPALGQLTEFNYSGPTGAQSWQTASNWGGGGFPNDPQHVANLSQALAGDLSIDLGGSGDVTVAGIKIGGTAGAVTTNITSGGATLRFQNTYTEDLANADFSKNAIVNGQDFLLWQRGYAKPVENPGTNNTTGDADLNGTVDGVDLGIWEENFGKNANGLLGGRPQVITGSVAGSVNTITAPIYMVHEIVEVLGPTDLTITGNISFENDEAVADDNVIDSSISSLTRGTTLTLNGTIDLQNKFDSLNGRFGLNTSGGSNGTLVVNSVISDGATTSSVQIGVAANGLTTPLNTVVLNAANTYGGSSWLSRTNLILNDPAALGTGTIRHIGPANQFGYNIIAGDDSLVNGELVLANDMIVGQWQSFRGDNSIRMTGDISQTNNRGFANLLIDGATLTLDGRLNIWEDDEALEREFEIEGSGTTIITGVIRSNPDEFPPPAGNLRRLRKSGTGVLVIDVAPDGNNHAGDDVVIMGNLHYATNDSLNSGGNIVSRGGAVGVDTGVANNSAFASKIDPSSTGGLMLAASDAAANLDFTGVLANAAKMTVAAPETGLTFTGSITPANSTYGLGGGTGKLTLPSAQLSGANSVEIRNGGEVELLGDNTYTGATKILTKYTSTQQERAEADNAQNIDGVFYEEVAPVLIVDDLANGGVASSIGAASSDAENLLIQGSTLRYVGTGDSTNRLFTIGTGGATIDSSGSGAVSFTNTGLLGRRDVSSSITGTLDDFSGNPNEIVEMSDTSDILIGMTVSDPQGGGTFTQPPCEPGGANCIPADTTVTGVSDDGGSIGISNNFPFILKENTQLVFGAVDRTLALTGSNTGDNTIASIISDSAAGSAVSVEKTGTGKWILSGANAYSGDTIVEEGVLSITSAFLDDDADVRLSSGVNFNLNFVGADVIGGLLINGTPMQAGLWGAPGNGGATFTSSLLSGTGLLNVGGMAAQALAAVPEPASLVLLAGAAIALPLLRRRRETIR